jgi:DNA-binding transcriptional regulator YdaS (Cro superfamily)
MSKHVLREYLDRSGRGAATKLGRAINVPVSLISDWANRKRRIPAERAPAIEAETGIRCEYLVPTVDWAVLRRRPVPEWAEQKVDVHD